MLGVRSRISPPYECCLGRGQRKALWGPDFGAGKVVVVNELGALRDKIRDYRA